MSDPTRIESPDNPKIKETARLRERRSRQKTGRFLVEGTRELVRALEGCDDVPAWTEERAREGWVKHGHSVRRSPRRGGGLPAAQVTVNT